MKCKKVEKWLLRSWDGALASEERKTLEEHLESCPLCRQKILEFESIRGLLRGEIIPDPLPDFWERLAPRLEEHEEIPAWAFRPQKGIRLATAALVLFVLVVGSLLFLLPRQAELSEPEILLLRNENPLVETQRLIEEKKIDDKNLRLIFAVAENGSPSRRYLP